MKSLFLWPLFFVFLSSALWSSEYKRSDWKHWVSQGSCQNTRAMILKERSLVAVSYKPRKDGKSCVVSSGLWEDFYFDEKLEDASLIDIDHIVPLHHAHESGGALWSSELKKLFANDPQNLAITNRSYNRQKGAKTPLEWMPINRQYACRYMKRWFEVKKKYELVISEQENQHYQDLNCEQAK